MLSTNTRNSNSNRHSGLARYYPFGMQMQGREFAGGMGYRWGFNGSEDDEEVKASGNSTDFGARFYDSRIGGWLSVDPRLNDCPGLSPYVGMNNSPIFLSVHCH
jgi:RHS repeat-associated protein